MVPSESPSALSGCGALDIAAGCAALTLHPPNAGHVDVLAYLAGEALDTCPPSAEAAPDWGALACQAERFLHGERWDASECPWTLPLPFFGQGHLLFSGGSPSNVFCLRQVLQAYSCASGWGHRSSTDERWTWPQRC
jgi:hypothetical protein